MRASQAILSIFVDPPGRKKAPIAAFTAATTQRRQQHLFAIDVTRGTWGLLQPLLVGKGGVLELLRGDHGVTLELECDEGRSTVNVRGSSSAVRERVVGFLRTALLSNTDADVAEVNSLYRSSSRAWTVRVILFLLWRKGDWLSYSLCVVLSYGSLSFFLRFLSRTIHYSGHETDVETMPGGG